jgi:hypothetical protein
MNDEAKKQNEKGDAYKSKAEKTQEKANRKRKRGRNTVSAKF